MGRRLRVGMLPGVRQQAWDEYVATGSLVAAAEAIGVHRATVRNWINAEGGIRPRRRVDSGRVGSGVRLSLADRVEIMVRRGQGESVRAIAAGLRRAPSTISRELSAHRDLDGSYRAVAAQRRAAVKRARPQQLKLGVDTVEVGLRSWVIEQLALGLSPQQVSGRLSMLAGSDPQYQGMSVHHETIYRAMFLQARGGLRREVDAALKTHRTSPDTADADPAAVDAPAAEVRAVNGSATDRGSDRVQGSALRTGRVRRQPRTAAPRTGRGRIPDIVPIGQRPPIRDADGVLLPGHCEGDLILGRNNTSAIGTIVERSTGYLWLLHLPHDHTAAAVETALIEEIVRWPEVLRQSLTWDRGKELSYHLRIAEKAKIKIYFADPRSPWQRPGNENINGLLRQYFPKGVDLSTMTRTDLDFVADQLNNRPRARLGYRTPNEMIATLLR